MIQNASLVCVTCFLGVTLFLANGWAFGPLSAKPQLKSIYLLTWSNILKIYGHKVVPVDAALFVEKSESVQDFMGCYS